MSRSVRLLLVGTLLATVAGLLLPAPAGAAERTVTYTVSARGAVQGDLGEFAAVARETLADPRGWALGGTLGFAEVAGGSDFDLVLAAPAVVAAASPGCSAQWSCRVGRTVYVNDERWRLATASWPHGLDLYRRYVVLHEVGHWLGLGHTGCPAPGRTASVMQQQSISLQGCAANVWPTLAEREEVGRRWGVPVAWSGIETRYRAMGAEGGVLGHPVTWEQPTGVGAGAFQGFRDGDIVSSPATGTHEVHGLVGARYRALGGAAGPLGYPLTDELATPDGRGRYNDFPGTGGSSIHFTPETGAHEVYGAIHARWAAMGRERSALGYPVSGEYDVPGGRRSDFQGGSIVYQRATDTTEVLLPG
jgi:uncharacterized protein with LGFP repeats